MTNKSMTGDCSSCESTYSIEFTGELVSEEFPEYCPFCGETIDELSEEYAEEDDDPEDENRWD
jgi:hypothetical protein